MDVVAAIQDKAPAAKSDRPRGHRDASYGLEADSWPGHDPSKVGEPFGLPESHGIDLKVQGRAQGGRSIPPLLVIFRIGHRFGAMSGMFMAVLDAVDLFGN